MKRYTSKLLPLLTAEVTHLTDTQKRLDLVVWDGLLLVSDDQTTLKFQALQITRPLRFHCWLDTLGMKTHTISGILPHKWKWSHIFPNFTWHTEYTESTFFLTSCLCIKHILTVCFLVPLSPDVCYLVTSWCLWPYRRTVGTHTSEYAPSAWCPRYEFFLIHL